MNTSAKSHKFGDNPPEVTIINSDSKEPALRTAANVTVTVSATLGLIQLLWPNIVSEEVKNAVLAVIVVLLPVITALFTRGKVWSPATVKELVRRVDVDLRAHYEAQIKKNNPYEKPDVI